MKLIALILVILAIVPYCFAIRCYVGYGSQIASKKRSDMSTCAFVYVPCSDRLVSCTQEETDNNVFKWAYNFGGLIGSSYTNRTVCSTDLCNTPRDLEEGSWCYSGYGQSKEFYEYEYVTKSSGGYCMVYGMVCITGSVGCTQEQIDNKHVMYYGTLATLSACSSYNSYNGYVNTVCCRGDFCAVPPTLRCNYGVSNATGSPLVSVETPFDDTTYSCLSYTEECNGTYCENGLLRLYYGYSKRDKCLDQPVTRTDVKCCTSDECNKSLKCYFGMSPKTAVLGSYLVDGYPTACSKVNRNCSVIQEGCTSEEIALGTKKWYYTYLRYSNCNSYCCSTDGCNAPSSLSCYNTTNYFNQSQPDSIKSIEKYDANDNCARFSYDCSNSLAKKYCTAAEISKGTIKTVYGSATDSECSAAQKDYMNILDPYCCKSALCNTYAAVKSSLSCYTGDYLSGQGIPKTSYIKLPSAGSYKCYSKTYTCTAPSTTCTQDNVDKKATRIEYGVTLSCTGVSCCSADLCNRLGVNPLIEPTTSTGTGGGGTGGGSGGSGNSTTNPRTSDKVSGSTRHYITFSVLLIIILVFYKI